ncbi:MAG: phenylalanine--tRNA ligase subunit beta [Thermoguttaceae bacterium]|jgi:phenylalanyl-tRNA synthetase beta chain
MIVSWNWLKQYVPLAMPIEELEERLMMAGLNHESTGRVGEDLAIDLEVTSNRPDCLGHVGIAREIAVLWDLPLAVPAARPAEGPASVADLVRVRIDCPDLCPRYTARVLRGVRVGPSPPWLVDRLRTIGIAAINNVVDVSNYVMMECGQPLHTFDYAKLRDPLAGTPAIVVRQPLPGETIEAIDHKTYRLEPGMCVIADAQVPVAIAGVMGGAGTEVAEATRDVLVEAAEFDPVATRTTARRLGLYSASSYRFERRVDSEGVDWASRRCCELILETAGGELAAGAVDVGQPAPPRQPIVLRLTELRRILGIDVPPERVRKILLALGNVEKNLPSPACRSGTTGRGAGGEGGAITVIPPSWRRDLTREIDLVEEIARIHGYDKIPEDASVPMAPSARLREDRVTEKVRHLLTATGFDEAVTLSAVDEPSARAVRVWTESEPLRTLVPVIGGADRLRTSLIPSLLAARRTNEALANTEIELFEIAKIYLPADRLPEEPWMLGLTSGRAYAEVRGVIEAVVAALRPGAVLQSEESQVPLLDPLASCRLIIEGQMLGYVGSVRPDGLKQFELRGPTTVAEVKLGPLVEMAELVPGYVPLSPYPAVARDVNLVVDEAVRWAQIAAAVRQTAGPNLESVQYRDTYRDPQRLGPGRKSLLFTVSLRSKECTLTNPQADEARDRIVAACGQEFGAELRAQ